QASKYAVPPDRIKRIERAGRLVLAAPRDRGRHQGPVDDDRGDGYRPTHPREPFRSRRRGGDGRPRARWPGRGGRLPPPAGHEGSFSPGPRSAPIPALPISSVSVACTPASPSLSASSPTGGRATITTSCFAGSEPSSCAKASRSSRFTRLRSTAPPTFRDTDRPSLGLCADAFANV